MIPVCSNYNIKIDIPVSTNIIMFYRFLKKVFMASTLRVREGSTISPTNVVLDSPSLKPSVI